MDVQDQAARNVKNKHSLRNKGKQSTGDRKPAFKTVLDTPYHVNWPGVPPSTSNAILKDLTAFFSDFVKKKELTHPPLSDEQKRALRKERREAKLKDKGSVTLNPEKGKDRENITTPESTLLGINAVTRDIESGQSSKCKVVIACKHDVSPSRLLAHLPIQISTLNTQHKRSVLLIELPKGSEEALAVSIKLKRVAVVGLTENHILAETIRRRLEDESKYTLKAPWQTEEGDPIYIPTQIKTIETTMPKDLRKAKEEKKKTQAAKKERILAYKQTQKLK
ncbi:hypothetical protein E3Q18_00554 [Wallemia mellicola]|nr:hypothetical protein E3Q18_00554 [Wallemia mellicola]